MNNQAFSKIWIIVIILVFAVGGILVWQYWGASKEEVKAPEISTEKYCEKDEDCACGVHKTTRDCFYGNKNYVDTTQQCPDFCAGITGQLQIKCINNECKQISTTIAEDETADWKIYKNKEYGFEIKYPSDILFIPEQVQYAPVLRSFSTTNIEESPVYDLAVYIDNVKVSASEDARDRVKDLPAYIEGSGPYEEQISGIFVYVTLTKLYGGLQGVTRSYYFQNFVLSFSYANSTAENRLKNVEQQMLSFFRLVETDEVTMDKISITAPIKGDRWIIGETYQIYWTPSDPTETVTIELLDLQKRGTYQTVWSKQVPNTGVCSFIIPSDLYSIEYAQLYIGNKLKGFSEGFSIISK